MHRAFPTPYLVTLGLWCEYAKLTESNTSSFPIALLLFAAAVLIPYFWQLHLATS